MTIKRANLRGELFYAANHTFISNLYTIHGKVLTAFYDEIYSVKKSMYFHVLPGLTALLAAMSGSMAAPICKLQLSCHLQIPVLCIL